VGQRRFEGSRPSSGREERRRKRAIAQERRDQRLRPLGELGGDGETDELDIVAEQC